MPDPPSLFSSGSSSRAEPAPLSNYIQPNLGHGLRIWWAFYWPTTLLATVSTFVVNISLRKWYESSDVPGRIVGPVMKYDLYFFTYLFAFFVMKYILRKNFEHFRIGLMTGGGEGAQPLTPTLRRTFRVWWTYCWRSLFYGLVAWIVVVYPAGWFLGIFMPGPMFVSVFYLLLALALSAAVGLWAIYSSILDEDIADFRVCLLPRREFNGPPAGPAINSFKP